MPAAGEESGDKQETSFLSTPASTPRGKLLFNSTATPSLLKSANETLLEDDSFESKCCTVPLSTPTPSSGDISRVADESIKSGLRDESIDRMVTEQGVMSIEITGGAKLFLTANGGIRLVHEAARVIVALSPNGGASALIHPSGRIYQHGSRVEIYAHSRRGNLLAKMWYKGISFATQNGALVYLLDDGGTRTVHDIFSDMSGDVTTPVFLDGAEVGPPALRHCAQLLAGSRHWTDGMGLTENWDIGGTKISRTPDDVVRITRGQNKYQLRACGSGLASISTPYIHCTASFGKTGPETSHIFVRRGERRLHYDGSTFILRNGGHSAGFDYNNEFRVF